MTALRYLPVLALAAAAAGCGIGSHLQRLDSLHDPKDFSHRPDVPETFAACLEEILVLADAEYEDPRESAAAIFVLARVATEDPAALHRAHGCRGLGRLGAFLAPSEDPAAGPPPTEGEIAAALQRIREIHGPGEEAAHADDAAVIECAACFRRAGDFRIPLLADPGPAGYGRDLKTLLGTLLGVLKESRGEGGLPGEAESERALRNLGIQVIRVALAGTILHDGDPRVRGEAALAASTFGGASLAGVLSAAYGAEPDVPARRTLVRAAAAVAARLENRARGPAVTLLLAALEDDDRGIRFEAREGMKGLAGEDLGERPGPWMRWWAEAQVAP